jgi:hypothetical protein
MFRILRVGTMSSSSSQRRMDGGRHRQFHGDAMDEQEDTRRELSAGASTKQCQGDPASSNDGRDTRKRGRDGDDLKSRAARRVRTAIASSIAWYGDIYAMCSSSAKGLEERCQLTSDPGEDGESDAPKWLAVIVEAIISTRQLERDSAAPNDDRQVKSNIRYEDSSNMGSANYFSVGGDFCLRVVKEGWVYDTRKRQAEEETESDLPAVSCRMALSIDRQLWLLDSLSCWKSYLSHIVDGGLQHAQSEDIFAARQRFSDLEVVCTKLAQSLLPGRASCGGDRKNEGRPNDRALEVVIERNFGRLLSLAAQALRWLPEPESGRCKLYEIVLILMRDGHDPDEDECLSLNTLCVF